MLHRAFAPLSESLFHAEVLERRIAQALASGSPHRLDVIAEMAQGRRCPVLQLIANEEPVLSLLEGHPDAAAGAFVKALRARHQELRNAHAASLHLAATGGDPAPALEALGVGLAAHIRHVRDEVMPWCQDHIPQARLDEVVAERARIKEGRR